MYGFDISVVATFHREGAIAVPTLRAIGLCRDAAWTAGLRVEIIATLDRADSATRDIVQAWSRSNDHTRVIELDVGDLGLARNAAFAKAAGVYGCTMDGDDLMSPGWLVRAHRTASLHPTPAVVHPEYVIEFGAGTGVTRLQGMHPASDLVGALLATHPWTSCNFSSLQAYRDVPYLGSTGPWTGFGFEDWHWNVEQLALGRTHVVARQTFLLYRKRPNSLLAEQVGANRLVGPLTLFMPDRVLAQQGGGAPRRTEGRFAAWVRAVMHGRRSKPTQLAVVPPWALPELSTLHGCDSAVPSTPSALKSHRYWEPRLNTAIGTEYARVVRRLWTPDVGRIARLTVVETPQAVGAALAATDGKILMLSRQEPAAGGSPTSWLEAHERVIAVPSSDSLDAGEVEALLTRLIVQLRPSCVEFESSARLAAFADRYALAFKSIGVRTTPGAWISAGSPTTTIES